MFEECDHLELSNNRMHVLHQNAFGSPQESLWKKNEKLDHLYEVAIELVPKEQVYLAKHKSLWYS
jgi:hypothetical protein